MRPRYIKDWHASRICSWPFNTHYDEHSPNDIYELNSQKTLPKRYKRRAMPALCVPNSRSVMPDKHLFSLTARMGVATKIVIDIIL